LLKNWEHFITGNLGTFTLVDFGTFFYMVVLIGISGKLCRLGSVAVAYSIKPHWARNGPAFAKIRRTLNSATSHVDNGHIYKWLVSSSQFNSNRNEMKQRSLGGTASHIKVGEIGYGLMGIYLLHFKQLS
jgi:hypothetical protein